MPQIRFVPNPPTPPFIPPTPGYDDHLDVSAAPLPFDAITAVTIRITAASLPDFDTCMFEGYNPDDRLWYTVFVIPEQDFFFDVPIQVHPAYPSTDFSEWHAQFMVADEVVLVATVNLSLLDN